MSEEDEDDDLDGDEDAEDEDDEDGGDEDGGDEDGGDEDEDGEPSGPTNEVVLDEDTEGVILAGRSIEVSGMLRRDLGKLAVAVKELGKRAGYKLQITPGGDHSTGSGPRDEDQVYCGAVIGIEADRGGTWSAEVVDRARLLEALEKARSIPAGVWDEVKGLLPDEAREAFEESEEPIALHLACVGPLAAATLAYGVPGGEGDADMPGSYHVGQDMEQNRHQSGVWGVRVGYCQYESPDTVAIDIDDEAHAARQKEVGAEGAGYFLMARYD